MWWGTQAGMEGRNGEVRGWWVGGGGEGPGDAAKRGGVAAPGPGSKSGQQPGLTQPRQWCHHLFPKHLVTGDRKSPLESRDPPSPLLRALEALTPAAGDPPPPQPGPWAASSPGSLGRWRPRLGGALCVT